MYRNATDLCVLILQPENLPNSLSSNSFLVESLAYSMYSITEKMHSQENTEELYKKYLQDPDNHDGVITHLEPDILKCDTKWASGSITTNKASGGDGFQLSYFKS